jgi:Flp pilus assembly pilin Flp
LGGAALSLAVIAALVTLWGELAIAFTFLGDVFEKTDPSEIAT